MKHLSKIGMLKLAVAVAAAAMGVGCASSPPLHAEESTSGIRAAEAAGAAEVPRAALHLQLAREELDHAQRLAMAGEKEKATSLLSRAEADAELAVALSRADDEKVEAQAAVERVRQLRQDNR